jgi:hypothetical protein
MFAHILPNQRIYSIDNIENDDSVFVDNYSVINNPANYKYDGTEFIYSPQPSIYHSTDAAGNWYFDNNLLEEAKKYMWNKIKEKRDNRKSGGVKIGTKWFHTDSESRIQQLGLVLMGANIPANLNWKTLDGSFVIMTQSLAVQLFQAIGYFDTVSFAVAEQHKANMNASADPYNYDFSQDWPLIYEETL